MSEVIREPYIEAPAAFNLAANAKSGPLRRLAHAIESEPNTRTRDRFLEHILELIAKHADAAIGGRRSSMYADVIPTKCALNVEAELVERLVKSELPVRFVLDTFRTSNLKTVIAVSVWPLEASPAEST